MPTDDGRQFEPHVTPALHPLSRDPSEQLHRDQQGAASNKGAQRLNVRKHPHHPHEHEAVAHRGKHGRTKLGEIVHLVHRSHQFNRVASEVERPRLMKVDREQFPREAGLEGGDEPRLKIDRDNKKTRFDQIDDKQREKCTDDQLLFRRVPQSGEDRGGHG